MTKMLCRRLFKEESFGPLIPFFKFSSDSTVVQLANNTEYGELLDCFLALS